MTRKALMTIAMTSLCSVALTVAALAQDYTVGIIQYVDHASLNQITDSIIAELEAKSAEGEDTYSVVFQNGQADQSSLIQITAQMLSEADVIIPIATPAVFPVQEQTAEQADDERIPVVFSAVSDPVSAGLVDSMDAPGANITGTSDALNTGAILDLMFVADPTIECVGLLYDKSQDSSAQPIEEAKAYLDGKGVKYIEASGTNTLEITQAAQSLAADGVKAVFTPTDNTIMTAELALYEIFTENGIAHYCGANSFALNGAFCGYGVDYTVLGQATADLAIEVLHGADPAVTPVQTFDNGIATINTETAEALGLDYSGFAELCTAVEEVVTQEEFE